MRTNTRGTRILIASLVLVIGGTLHSTGAQAHIQPYDWKNGDLVGCGGLTNGTYVKSAQAMLWAGGFYGFNGGGTGNVDGYYGANTAQAIKNFQSTVGLHPDGCVGFFTWDRFTHKRNYLYWDGGNTTYYRWQWPYVSAYITYAWNGGICWSFQWFDGWRVVGHGFSPACSYP